MRNVTGVISRVTINCMIPSAMALLSRVSSPDATVESKILAFIK
jgi:hypothetical protein